MKAKPVEDPDVVSENTVVETKAVETIISAEIVRKEFTQRIELKSFAHVEVKSDEDLTIAENNSSQINQVLKNIEVVRKTLKEPYLVTGKLIDEYAKVLAEPYEKLKTGINSSITNYKAVQTAAARLKAEELRKEAEKLVDIQAAEADRISRISSQLLARLYGGSWQNTENQLKTAAGCFSIADCDNLLTIIEEKVPKDTTFTYMVQEYNDMLASIRKLIAEHKVNLLESESESQVIKENAFKNIERAKNLATGTLTKWKSDVTENIVKTAQQEIRKADKEVKEAGKSVRKTLVFEVDNIKLVPKEWMVLDDVKVRAWAAENKVLIMESIKAGNDVIHGVKFKVSETYVSS